MCILELYYYGEDNLDPEIIEIFNKYENLLIIIGINFDSCLLERIAYCDDGLEDIFISFCAWVLYKKEKKEIMTEQILKYTLIEAICSKWKPSNFQKNFLEKYKHLLKSRKEYLWQYAEKNLGRDRLNQIAYDITEEGILLFKPGIKLTDKDIQVSIDLSNIFNNN